MPLNKTKADIRDRRRQLVAEIMVRRPRVTQRQIRETLARKGHVNPQTEEPWSLGTINLDVEAIREAARTRMQEDADTWRARELEMLRHLQADAWDASEYGTVVRISKRRSKLLGLDEPDELRVAPSTDALSKVLLEALQDHPEARRKAAEAIASMEDTSA